MRIRLLFSDDNRHEREATRQRRGNANACSGPEAAKAAKGRVGLIRVRITATTTGNEREATHFIYRHHGVSHWYFSITTWPS